MKFMTNTTTNARVLEGMIAFVSAERPRYDSITTLRLATIQQFRHLREYGIPVGELAEDALELVVPNYYSVLTREEMLADDMCNDPDLF